MNETQMEKLVDNLLKYLPLFYQKVTTPEEATSKQRLNIHYQILGVLEHYDDLPISHIGKKLHISKPNMTVQIDKLAEEGMVKRLPDKKDRRIIRIEITPKGKGFIETSQKEVEVIIKKNLSTLSKEELESLYQSTENIKKILLKIDEV
ncbi:MAG: MarR family transcriptional regulator [Methanobacterium paludis]|nr:MarR family transcriptional regulator [Methanobacterium paludis]